MANDIALQVQPLQLNDPVKQYANVLAIQGAQQQNRLADFQYKTGQEAYARQNALRGALSGAGGDEAAYGNALAQYGTPEQVAAYRKAKLESEKTDAELQKIRMETGIKAMEQYRQNMPTDPQSAAAWIQAQYSDPMVSPIVSRMQPIQAALSKIPTEPAQFQEWVARNALGMEKFIEKNAPQLSTRDVGGSVQDRTFRPLTGEITSLGTTAKTATPDALMADARGRVANNIAAGNLGVSQQRLALESGDGKPLTEAQGNATGFGLRARESADLIAELENSGTFGRIANINSATRAGLDRIPIIGTALSGAVGGVGHAALTAPQQQYAQARDDFIRAVLRKESGATISPAEIQGAEEQYFPRVGEGKDVIEQKRKNRETAIKSLGIQAGPGGKKIPASRALTTTAPPKGVEKKLWDAMTPEEKALWE